MKSVTPMTGVDTTGCDREPIHLSGAIQPLGVLVVCALDDWTIRHVSANAHELFGATWEQLLGQPLRDVTSREFVHDLANLLASTGSAARVNRTPAIRWADDGPLVDIALHYRDGLAFIEFERREATTRGGDQLISVQAMLARALGAETIEAYCERIAQQVRGLTFFERVMVYRFREDGSGEVVGESRRNDLPTFIGLRWPASDIPRQARRLYLENWTRGIADATYDPVPIEPPLDATGAPLDLSQVGLRSVSPIHRQYLRNMGVSASFSISLVCGGQLWGLIACHSATPLWPSQETRTAAELFGVLASMQLESRLRRAELDEELRARGVHDRIVAAVSMNDDLLAALRLQAPALRTLVPCHAIAFLVGDDVAVDGGDLPPAAIAELRGLLADQSVDGVYANDALGGERPDLAALTAIAAGVLAVPLSRRPRDFIVFLRRELAEQVRWAGDPDKSVLPGGPGQIAPRASFSAWLQDVRGRSAPWTDNERRNGERLRHAILEIVLQFSAATTQSRREAEDRQKLLVAELNHRVKNLLALMQGLVSRSKDSAESLNHFVLNLQGRISALAAAHDQISPIGGAGAGLRGMVETELAPYATTSRHMHVDGPPVALDPGAQSVLALVLHELATNAAKYGALTAAHGTVDVRWHWTGAGELSLTWEESGGPAVQPPTREGFGTTLIARTVPFELRGDATIEYLVTGLRATFVIPARYCTPLSLPDVARAPAPALAHAGAASSSRLPDGLRVLVVEDQMLIAMETEHLLREAGASEVVACSSVAAAMRVLDSQPIDVAVLDINLNGETSLPVADRLAGEGRRFIFATGYNDSLMIPPRFRLTPVVRKPVVGANLLEGLKAALAAG